MLVSGVTWSPFKPQWPPEAENQTCLEGLSVPPQLCDMRPASTLAVKEHSAQPGRPVFQVNRRGFSMEAGRGGEGLAQASVGARTPVCGGGQCTFQVRNIHCTGRQTCPSFPSGGGAVLELCPSEPPGRWRWTVTA